MNMDKLYDLLTTSQRLANETQSVKHTLKTLNNRLENLEKERSEVTEQINAIVDATKDTQLNLK